MSTLDSQSTLQQIQAAYADNASYEEDGSVTKAKAFVTAVRLLLQRIPKRSSMEQSEVEHDPRMLQDELIAARRFIATTSAAGGSTRVLHPSFVSLRT